MVQKRPRNKLCYYTDYNVKCTTFNYSESGTSKKRYSVFSVDQVSEPLPPNQKYMINFRVSNLEETLKKAVSAGSKVTEMEIHNEGKFAWTWDPDGNKVELWQDND